MALLECTLVDALIAKTRAERYGLAGGCADVKGMLQNLELIQRAELLSKTPETLLGCCAADRLRIEL